MPVVKRDGSTEELDLSKIHSALEWACYGKPAGVSNLEASLRLKPLKGVSVSQIELQAQGKLEELFKGRARTKDINAALVSAAADLISEDTPHYDKVAARMLWLTARKEAFGGIEPPPLFDVVRRNVKAGVYTPELLELYSEKEYAAMDRFVRHDRDDLFHYAGAMQMYTKMLAQNRKSGKRYESFQHPYILIAALLFAQYPKELRLDYVRRYYDRISQHYISLPTPIIAGLRTRTKQFSSCSVLSAGDSLESITETATGIVEYASRKAGIGLDVGRIRAAGQPVRGGDAVTTGIVPFAKFMVAALKSCSQGAVRGASATLNWPLWHLEFERLIELKNNKGIDETRIRNVDYNVHLHQVFFERLAARGVITFFSPEEVPEVWGAFYSGDVERFRTVYEAAERNARLTKKQLPAVAVFAKLAQERFETGRIYVMHADHVNRQTPFLEPITSSNLCQEIALPTKPLSRDGGEIALCTLSAINVGKIETEEDMAESAELAVRALDALLDYQHYPHAAAFRSAAKYRPLGIGMIGFSHWLTKYGITWAPTKENHDKVEALVEGMAWHLTRASMELAREYGPCPGQVRYAEGWLPMDDAKIPARPTRDWDQLRRMGREHGIRNATLLAFMPSETSSQLANETNGIEAPRALVVTKGSKDVLASQVVPEVGRLGHAYQLAWDIPTEDYLAMLAVLQKYTDQAISANTSYDPGKGDIGLSKVVSDLLLAWKLGLKTLYYSNTRDGAGEDLDKGPAAGGGCESGACTL